MAVGDTWGWPSPMILSACMAAESNWPIRH
jgi:hypothetical protein